MTKPADDVPKTHVMVASYRIGPYHFFSGVRRGVLVVESELEWWVARNNKWLQTESFGTLEAALVAAGQCGTMMEIIERSENRN